MRTRRIRAVVVVFLVPLALSVSMTLPAFASSEPADCGLLDNGCRLWSDLTGATTAWIDPVVDPGTGTIYVAGSDGDLVVGAYDGGTGEKLWTTTKDVGRDSARSLALDTDSGALVVTGATCDVESETVACSSHSFQWLTAAFDAEDGSALWSSVSEEDGWSADVTIGPSGDRVLVTGGVGRNGSGVDYQTAALDTGTGERRWTANYTTGGTRWDQASGVAVDPEAERVYVTGFADMFGADAQATIAYDARTGEEMWRRVLPEGTGSAIALDPRGERVYVTGAGGTDLTCVRYGCHPSSGLDYVTWAFDAGDGATVWRRYHDGPSKLDDRPSDLAVSPDGRRLFVTGEAKTGVNTGPYTVYPTDNRQDFATVAYDTLTGAELWSATYSGPRFRDDGNFTRDEAEAVTVGPEGRWAVVTGWSQGIGTSADIASVAYDAASGAERWSARYDRAGGVDRPLGVATAPSNGLIHVAGSAEGQDGGDDAALITYDAPWP